MALLKRLLLVVNTLLALLVMWTASQIGLNWAYRGKHKSPLQSSTNINRQLQGASPRASKTFKDYSSIIQYDIFRTKMNAPALPRKTENLKVSNLDLVLMGTAIGNQHESYAILFDNKTKKEELYYMNSLVQGARIIQIMPDRIVLENNGEQEVLVMTEKRKPSLHSRSPVTRLSTKSRGPISVYRTYPAVPPTEKKQRGE